MKGIKIVFLGLMIGCVLQANAESRKEFIKKYKNIAITEMERTGIPASIKLAQGILESGCGSSPLAVNANNHFGIKCHEWEGPTYQMDDDAPSEHFRKYEHAEQSWIDHSTFLTTRPRYADLFNIPTTDYKAWARGLKAAGYATNPQYAEMLIKIIEEEELYQYDRVITKPEEKAAELQNLIAENEPVIDHEEPEKASYRNREEMRNGVLCIKAHDGDTYDKIATYYGISVRKLLAYNDTRDYSLEPGQLVFIKSKKLKAARGYEYHRVKEGETLYSISQMYGVKLRSIARYNYIDEDSQLIEGEKLYLRGKTKLYE